MNENYSYWLLQEFKTRKGLKANKELGNYIDEMSESNVSNIKAGRRQLTPEQGLFIAEQCGMDIGEVLVKLDMERTKNPAVQEALSSLLKRIAGAVAVISLSLGLIMTPVSEAKASA